MPFDIAFSRPEKHGKCTATLFEMDEQGTRIAGRSWNQPFNAENIDNVAKLADLKADLFAKVKIDDDQVAEVTELHEKAVAAKVTIKPVVEVVG